MAIRMRVNRDRESHCCECLKVWNDVSEMYDIQAGGNAFIMCRKCMETLSGKLLRASCLYNGRLKTKEDMERIRREGMETLPKGHLTVTEALKGVGNGEG